MSTYKTPYWSYTPNEAVVAAHNIPHVYANGQMATATSFNVSGLFEFSSSSIQEGKGWLPGLFTVPFILLALGLISIVLMDLAFMFRCCCRCLKCGPTEEMIQTDPLKVVKKRKFIWYWFLFWVFITLIADHALFFGNADMDKAIDSGASSLGRLAGLFKGIKYDVDDMGTQWANYQAAVLSANSKTAADYAVNGVDGAYCDFTPSGNTDTCVQTLNCIAAKASSATTSLGNLIGNLPDKIDTFKGYLGEQAKSYKNNIVYILYAVIACLVVAYPVTAYFCHSKCFFYLLMLISELVVLVYTFICAILMFIVMFLGDFCMNPNTIIKQPKILSYYMSCEGTSPFGESIDTISDSITDISNKLTAGGTLSNCPSNAAMTTPFDVISTDFKSIGSHLDCGSGDNLNMVWNDAVNVGICGNFMNGLFKIWVSQYVVSGALFFTIICASVLYQYFGPAWHLKATGEDASHKDVENPSANAPEYELAPADFDGGEQQAPHGHKH